MSLMSDCNLLTCTGIFINTKSDWHELHVPNIVSVNQKLSYDYHIMMWYWWRSILPDLILPKFDLRLIFYIYLDTLSRGCCMYDLSIHM